MLTKIFGGLILVAAISGCTTRVTDFTVISTKNQQATTGFVMGQRASGEDCVPVIFVPIGTPNLKAAIDHTIENAGAGFDALVDGVVLYHNNSFVFGSICYEVQGTPINSKARKTALLFDPNRVWKHSGAVASSEGR